MKVFNINYEPCVEKVHAEIERRCGRAAGTCVAASQETVSARTVPEMEADQPACPGWICVADGNILAMVHNDLQYRQTVEGSLFAIVDSSWVPLFVRHIYGWKWRQYCGSQIFDDITKMRRYRMYFLGTKQEVLDALREQMVKVDPDIARMKFVELPFCSAEEFDYPSIAADINADNPDIIWLALGAPKQEKFAAMLVPYLKRGVVIPVGAVFNFRSGLGIRRAPQWMVKCHLEFVYRIFSEPGKQLRRCRDIIATFPKIYREELKRKNDKQA